MKPGEKKRLRILIIEPSGLLWGSERSLIDLLSHLDPAYEVFVVCPRSTPLAARLAVLGANVIERDIGMLHRRGRLARLKAFAWLALTIRRNRPDVIHVNEAGVTAIVAAARLGTSPPVVTHVRLQDDAEVLARRLPRLAAPQIVVAVSNFIAEKLRPTRNPINPPPTGGASVRVVYNPFDAGSFSNGSQEDAAEVRRELGLSESDKVVLMVGRVCRDKRQDLLLDAAARLENDHTKFLFAGDVPADAPDERRYRDSLLERARSPGLRDRVVFLGGRDDVARLMIASDVVALASSNEAFGRVFLEALSLGKPVVGPDAGGPAEIIGDNERGYLFGDGDAVQLSEVIREVIASPAAAALRATEGRKWVERECSPESHARRIETLWEEASRGAR